MSERYRKFYEEYKNRLFSYLMYKSGDYELSRDLMQESFARHFKNYGNDAVASPALLFTIARNALVDHHRYHERFQLVESVDQQADASADHPAEGNEETARINAALDRLPGVDREILTLAVSGTAYKEIAALFNITEANVKVRVHRIRTKLRTVLLEEAK